jgi:phage tail-like protein
VADRCRCYAGEDVTFYIRITPDQTLESYELVTIIPVGLQVTKILPTPMDVYNVKESDKSELDGTTKITWLQKVDSLQQSHCEYEVTARISSFDVLWNYQKQQEEMWRKQENDKGNQQSVWHTPDPAPTTITLYCRTTLCGTWTTNAKVMEKEIVSINVFAKGQYLQYLPALYEQNDDFLARFLVLFESFWSPIDHQIEHIDNYFDLAITPLDFLKWLASWFDLELSTHWSELQKRAVVAEIVQLYRKRGTRSGLQRYLQLMTGSCEVEITEYIAEQFRIGLSARLGGGIAVGREGKPHTFDVQIRLPKSEHYKQMAKPDRERIEEQDRKVLEAIIEAEKPAHTAYGLSIEYAESVKLVDFAKSHTISRNSNV